MVAAVCVRQLLWSVSDGQTLLPPRPAPHARPPNSVLALNIIATRTRVHLQAEMDEELRLLAEKLEQQARADQLRQLEQQRKEQGKLVSEPCSAALLAFCCLGEFSLTWRVMPRTLVAKVWDPATETWVTMEELEARVGSSPASTLRTASALQVQQQD